MVASPPLVETQWFAQDLLLTTHLSGDVDDAAVQRWHLSLQQALNRIEDGGAFKILVNLHGFTATDLGAHKAFRSIIPLTLADYGWKVGYVDLFEEEAGRINYRRQRGIRCFGAAHCHHDATKIDNYNRRFGYSHERFFTDPALARTWLDTLALV